MFIVTNRRFFQAKTHFNRYFCIKATKNKPKETNKPPVIGARCIGQPTFETHPHLLRQGEITPRITREEYQTRRLKLVELISKHSIENDKEKKCHMIIIPAATKKYMSDKIPYVFRQNSEFLYLTGCQEPDCVVAITIGESSDRNCTILFTRDKDEHSELWDGPRTYPEDAPGFFGVNQSLPMSELGNYIRMYRKTYKNLTVWYDFLNPIQDNVHNLLLDFLTETNNKHWESPRNYIHTLRLFKSPAEIQLMQETCDVASQAITRAISSSKPGIGENEIFATVDYECRMRGAEYLAYPPVVAGGPRATTIHYINNNQIVHNGELVLMDAGCEYHGYASDITRTWPVNGQFSTEQRIIYEIVLSVQQELIRFCGTLPTLDQMFETMCSLLGKRLLEAGLISAQPSSQYLMKAAYQLCPHHVSHYLGMDVHDTSTIMRNVQLKPGMIITVEPGVYVNNKNLIVPKEYRGIGVRIEDDVLITENGPVVLSRNCPKSIGDIEKIAGENQ